MTTGTATGQLPANPAQQSRNLLRSIYKKRRPIWILLAIVVFAISLAFGLFVFPQTYTSMTSISLSQPSGGTSQLALLAGGGGGKAKYLGPLKSHNFAEQVEKKVHLKELYQLPDEDEAVDKLLHSVRFDDNATEGLLYITASLEGPPKMAANSEERRKQIEKTVALIGQSYAQALKDYIVYSDTDKDSVLRRSADEQIKTARAGYNNSVEQWINFVRDSKSPTVGVSASPSSQSPELAALQALYLRRGQLEVQMRSTDESIARTRGLVNKSDTQIGKIPTEDPLLTEARRRYTEAQRDVKDLLIQYSENAPPVLRAKERLKIAETHLTQQAESIMQGNTSENVKRQAMEAEHDTILSQIAEAERGIQVTKRAATSFERLHAEVELSLKVLEATATRRAELEMQTVSNDQRIRTVDVARPPKRGKPGMVMTVFISALVAIMAVLAWYGIEFTIRSSQMANGSVEAAAGGN